MVLYCTLIFSDKLFSYERRLKPVRCRHVFHMCPVSLDNSLDLSHDFTKGSQMVLLEAKREGEGNSRFVCLWDAVVQTSILKCSVVIVLP